MDNNCWFFEFCHEKGFVALNGHCLQHFREYLIYFAAEAATRAEKRRFNFVEKLYKVETLLGLREGEIHLPKITSGGPEAADENILRTDITPEDIRKMSIEEINELLAKIRASRQTTSSSGNSGRTRAPAKPKTDSDADELDDLE